MNRFAYLGLAVLAVVVLWSGAWFFIAGQVRASVLVLAQGDGVVEPKITCDTLDVRGFPFYFDADCTGATLLSGDVSASVERVGISALAYRPTQLRGRVQGPATIADSFTGSRSQVAWSDLEMSFRLEGWRIGRLSVVARDVTWNDTVFGETLLAQSPLIEVHVLDAPERYDAARGLAGLALFARADDVVAPRWQLSGGDATLEADVHAAPDDIRLLADPGMLRRWQQNNGRVDVVGLNWADAETSLSGQGNLALDTTGHLEGQIRINSRGLVERTGALLAEPFRSLVLGSPAEDGSYSQTLDIRGGVVFAGPLPVTAIPPLF
jgi:hypothetical protein